jgi:hypothetical protein
VGRPTLEHVGHSPSIALDMPPGGSLYLGAHTRGSAAPVPAHSDLAVVCISRGSADGLEDTYTLTVLCPGALTASTLASGVGAAQGDVMAAGARLTLHDGARLRFAPRGAEHHDRAGYVCILQRYGAAIWQPLPREIDPEHTFLTAPLTAQVRDALELRSSWDVDTPLFGDVGAEDEQDQFEREGLVSSSTGAALPLDFFMDERLTIRTIVDHIRDNSGPYLTLERHRDSIRAARAAHAAAARTHERCERKLRLLHDTARTADVPHGGPEPAAALAAARRAAAAELRASQSQLDQRRGQLHACLRRRVADTAQQRAWLAARAGGVALARVVDVGLLTPRRALRIPITQRPVLLVRRDRGNLSRAPRLPASLS